jgi:hypothetical protein
MIFLADGAKEISAILLQAEPRRKGAGPMIREESTQGDLIWG